MQSARIPKYKAAKGNKSARTDSGFVPNKRRSIRRIKGKAARKTVNNTELTGNPNAPSEVVTTAVITATPAVPVTVPPVPATQVVKPPANRSLQGLVSTSTVSSPAPSKRKTTGAKLQKKKSSLRGPRKKVAPLGRSDLEEIDDIDLITPTQDASIAPKSEMDMLKEAKRLWLQFSAENEPGSKIRDFQYGVFNAKHSKIIIATPMEELGETQKPTNFNITTIHGEQVCEVHYTTGSFCKPNLKIQVKMHDENIGSVKQESNSLIVFEQTGQEIMRFTGVPKGTMCNKSGPDAFNCEVYLSERSYHHSVGVFGKNSKKPEQVMLGVASGFYFIAAKGTQNEFDVFHKVFILSAMVTLMTYFAK